MIKRFFCLFSLLCCMLCIDAATPEHSVNKEVTVSGNKDGHDYVDLGLPSGRLWATCNVGASNPFESGYYFAWGERKPKKDYSMVTYKWSKDGRETFIRYDKDGKKVIDVSDDAATINWGIGWRMPTHAEQKELLDGCNWEWTNDFNGSGIPGEVGTSKTNSNIIFLYAAGYRGDTNLYDAFFNGLY